MSWIDRLRPEIKFVSPSGLIFTPLWKGDDISAGKRLGRHAYPNVDREIVQDMGMNSREVPLTVYFDGPDNDVNSRAFEEALFEPDVWEVTHPVDGLMSLQLISYTRKIEPVESGNVTVFETEWVEPANEDDAAAVVNLAAAVESAIEGVNTGIMQDAENVKTGKLSELREAAAGFKRGLDSVKFAFTYADALVNTAQSAINDMSNNFYLYTASIAGSIISIVESPGLILGSLADKMTMFIRLGNTIKDKFLGAGRSTGEILNSALTGELFLNAILAGMAQTMLNDPPETRGEALAALETYLAFDGETEAALEGCAGKTSGEGIDNQYTVRANSSAAVKTLKTAVANYLMGSLYDLKISKRIVLDMPKTPLGLAVEEMGGNAGNACELYLKLCAWNNLRGKDLLLLPAGREITIYA